MDDRFTVTAAGFATYEEASRRNVERFIGTAQVPIGLAGPLEIRGQAARGTYHVPMATTEGTIVASTCRGMRVLNDSGGCETRVTRRGGIQRAPVFRFGGYDDAIEFARRVEADWKQLAAPMEATTRHGKLTDVRCFVQGQYVHVRLSIDPGQASGQNMVSVAAAAAVELLRTWEPQAERVYMEGGLSGEKVSSNLNVLLGRGRAASARAVIPGDVLRETLRAEPSDLVELYQLYTTSNLWAGTKNSHAALINVLPAIFIATGQDVAAAPGSCMAQTLIRYDAAEDTVDWQVLCPNLVVGTVGGGTALPTQAEALASLGCAGPGEGNADALAEICAATALASEVSFLGAICAQEWVAAHAKVRKR
ncbi:MAG: hydroxymethylglutaryl-CoA reductase [Proteobacteria bacterium]|nr:hydroxymethylglutaryl-CoA reductase [Pseudomonadota bacterium]